MPKKLPDLEKIASPFALMIFWNYLDDYRRAGFSGADVGRALVRAARPGTKPAPLLAFMRDMLGAMQEETRTAETLKASE